MNTLRDHDAVIGAWLDDGPQTLPAETRQAITVGIRTVSQRRAGIAWPFAGRGPRTIEPRQLAIALGSAAAVVVVAALALGIYVNRPGIGVRPSPTPSVEPTAPTSASTWPQLTLSEVQTAQELADAGDRGYTWQLGPDLEAHLAQGGPYREPIFTRFLEEKLGWEEFQWTLGNGAYEGRVVFLRCAPGVATVAPLGQMNNPCAPTIDESRYETVQINVAQPVRQGPTGIWVVTSWEMLEPFEGTEPLVDAEVIELLTGFVEARVAGEGAEQYLNDEYGLTLGDDIPLLYATTSGINYNSWAFDQVIGYEWPYGLTAFKVRMYAGDRVVEQLIFWSAEDSPQELAYVPDGFGTDIAPTTEDGQPVARPYSAFDGEVTLHVAHPWVFRYAATTIGLIPEDAVPTTDGGERNDWDRLVLMADPTRSGTGCPTGTDPADSEALAESIRSDPNLEATAPLAVGAAGAEGLMIDVRIVAGVRGACATLYGDTEFQIKEHAGPSAGDRMRLYLFDAPEGLPMRILAIVMVVPESQFERAVVGPAPLVAVEFHAP